MKYVVNIKDADLILSLKTRDKQLRVVHALPFSPTFAVVVDNGRPLTDYRDLIRILDPLAAGYIITVQDSYAEGIDGSFDVQEYTKKFRDLAHIVPSATGRPVIYELGNEVNLPRPYQSADIWLKVQECASEARRLGITETGITYFDDDTIPKFVMDRGLIPVKYGMKSIYPVNVGDMDQRIQRLRSTALTARFLATVGAQEFLIREYGVQEMKTHITDRVRKVIEAFEEFPGAGFWDFQGTVVRSPRLQLALGNAWRARKLI